MEESEYKKHVQKMPDYLLNQGAKVTLKSLSKPQADFTSVQEIVEKALEHEKNVTDQVHEILALSRSENDPATENFIGWKVAEQVEEVASVEYLLTLTKTASTQRDLFMLEGKVGKLVAAKKGH